MRHSTFLWSADFGANDMCVSSACLTRSGSIGAVKSPQPTYRQKRSVSGKIFSMPMKSGSTDKHQVIMHASSTAEYGLIAVLGDCTLFHTPGTQ